MANQVNNQRHKYHPLTAQYHNDSNMTPAQVVETSVTVTNSSFQNYTHPDDHARQTTDTPGFKPFTKKRKKIFVTTIITFGGKPIATVI